MKSILFALFIMTASLLGVGLEWDANPPLDQVAEYVVYEKNATGQFAEIGRVNGVTTKFILGAVIGPKTYAVTAVNVQGLESDLSDEVTLLPKPGKPSRPRITK